MHRTGRRARIAGATLRGLLALGFAVAGILVLAGFDAGTMGVLPLGSPGWLGMLVGIGEVVGAALLLFRGYAALGAALLIAVMMGTVGTVLLLDASLSMVVAPLILMALLLFVIYAQRRRLREAALSVAGA